jgi:diguanylate cyclase (GGDEF)-like protein
MMMSVTIFFWVLPAVYLCFAVLFFWASRSTRGVPTARWAAIGFATAVVAIPIDHMRDPPVSLGFLAAIPLHWLIVTALINAFLARRGQGMPRRVTLRIFAVGLAMVVFTTWIMPMPVARMMTVNLIAAALIHVGMIQLWRHRDKPIDRAVAYTMALSWLSYMLRLFMLGMPAIDDEFIASPIWSQYMLVFYAVSGISAMMNGLLITIAVTIDVMARSARESLIDPLTGVANRRQFEQIADDPAAADQFTAALMIDLDHFRDINTRHGHSGGDAVLRHASQRIAAEVPPGGVLVRMGGEEFAVLIPRSSAIAPADIGARIVAAIAAQPVPLDDTMIAVTTSLGVALRGADEPLNDALRRADQALYEAKVAGRNCVRLAPSEIGAVRSTGQRSVQTAPAAA